MTGVSSYLRKNYEPLLAPYMKRHALTTPASPRRTPDHKVTTETQHSVGSSFSFQNANGATTLFDEDISIHAQKAADEVLKALGYTSSVPQISSMLFHSYTKVSY